MSKTSLGFTRCIPDRDSFNQVVSVKSPIEWNVEEVELDYGVKYWVADNPFTGDGLDLFMDVVKSFPICADTNYDHCDHGNPFATIHLPEWAVVQLCVLIKDYFLIGSPANLGEWGNLYFREDCRPWDYFRLPHCDGPRGMIGNLWLTDHNPEDRGTIIYKYHGKHTEFPNGEMFFDYQVDPEHYLYDECKHLSANKKRLSHWNNLTEEEEQYWGFERLAVIPAQKGTITLYEPSTPHAPFISDKVDFSWSHTFAVTQ